MAEMISFEVHDKEGQAHACEARAGESLLDALREHGFEVPSLCHLKGLSPYGACRLCLVEVQQGKKRRLTTSCNFPVMEGIAVHLDTERVSKNRRMVIELLSSMAPKSQRLSDLARTYGVSTTRLDPRQNADDCILCGLCTRVCSQGARAEALALAGRGRGKHLAREPFDEFPESCIGCGACAWVCPTGAISMEDRAVARMKDRWGAQRPCRYALMGLAPGSVCENNYDCARCEVDQSMVARAGGRHPIMLMLEAEKGTKA